MNKTTITNPATMEIIPCDIASFPSEGPIIASSTIFVGAGKAPAFNKLAKSFASSIEKLPEITELPPPISSSTVGADKT